MERMTFARMLQTSKSFVSDDEYERVLNRRERQEPREGIECDTCGNWEFVWVVQDGERMTRECACKTKRNNFARIRASGLKNMLNRHTFKNFETKEPWQKAAKETVLRFCKDENRGWMLMSGQPGCGKTHLCTAAAGRFMQYGLDTRYMRWVDESTTLKACVTDEGEYKRILDPLKTCKVLYIDDFWKTQRGKDPTPADVKLAFDLLDYRYCNPGLITIISTERTIQQLLDIDPAVGSRIYERTKGYLLEFGYSSDKNWRLK